MEFRVRHPETRDVIEILHIQLERAVLFQVDQLFQDQVPVDRLAVGSEPHDLVFAGIDPETRVVGERGIEKAERVREPYFGMDLDRIPFSRSEARGRPFSDAVHRDKSRLLEWRREKSGRGVRLMMLGKKDLAFVAKLLLNEGFHPKLLLDPHGNRLEEGPDPLRGACEVAFKDAFKFQEGFVVKRDNIEVFRRDPAFSQAIFDRVRRETEVVLLPRKPLFLRRRDDLPVTDKARGAVMIKSRDAENLHAA
ncbi:MAG: hypothetical protein BWY42_01390 [Candidatus Omnitrophica bacterium ADurb.Bin277]|nr:MAG: hypothetical protein BWY42_01390 [Candidatus Omnitrophica bacterium ADurb.Bin277]